MFCFKLPIRMVLKRIENADASEIDAIVSSLIECHRSRYPEYEMVIMTLPKYDLKKRYEEIDKSAEWLKKYVHKDEHVSRRS